MPGSLLSLNFHVEDRAGVMVVVFNDGIVRPASATEVELWNLVTSKFQNSRESYVRINLQDLLALTQERDHFQRQIKDLHTRNTELVEANRVLRKEQEELRARVPADSGPTEGAAEAPVEAVHSE